MFGHVISHMTSSSQTLDQELKLVQELQFCYQNASWFLSEKQRKVPEVSKFLPLFPSLLLQLTIHVFRSQNLKVKRVGGFHSRWERMSRVENGGGVHASL